MQYIRLGHFIVWAIQQHMLGQMKHVADFSEDPVAYWPTLVTHINTSSADLPELPGLSDDIHKQAADLTLFARELISNTIDAKATVVSIDQEPGHFHINDNGMGISPTGFVFNLSIPKLSEKSSDTTIGQHGLGFNLCYQLLVDEKSRMVLSSTAKDHASYSVYYQLQDGEIVLAVGEYQGNGIGTQIDITSTLLTESVIQDITTTVNKKFELKPEIDLQLTGYTPIDVPFTAGTFFEQSEDKRHVVTVRRVEVQTHTTGSATNTCLARFELPSDVAISEDRSAMSMAPHLYKFLSQCIDRIMTLDDLGFQIKIMNTIYPFLCGFADSRARGTTADCILQYYYDQYKQLISDAFVFPDVADFRALDAPDQFAVDPTVLQTIRPRWFEQLSTAQVPLTNKKVLLAKMQPDTFYIYKNHSHYRDILLLDQDWFSGLEPSTIYYVLSNILALHPEGIAGNPDNLPSMKTAVSKVSEVSKVSKVSEVSDDKAVVLKETHQVSDEKKKDEPATKSEPILSGAVEPPQTLMGRHPYLDLSPEQAASLEHLAQAPCLYFLKPLEILRYRDVTKHIEFTYRGEQFYFLIDQSQKPLLTDCQFNPVYKPFGNIVYQKIHQLYPNIDLVPQGLDIVISPDDYFIVKHSGQYNIVTGNQRVLGTVKQPESPYDAYDISCALSDNLFVIRKYSAYVYEIYLLYSLDQDKVIAEMSFHEARSRQRLFSPLIGKPNSLWRRVFRLPKQEIPSPSDSKLAIRHTAFQLAQEQYQYQVFLQKTPSDAETDNLNMRTLVFQDRDGARQRTMLIDKTFRLYIYKTLEPFNDLNVPLSEAPYPIPRRCATHKNLIDMEQFLETGKFVLQFEERGYFPAPHIYFIGRKYINLAGEYIADKECYIYREKINGHLFIRSNPVYYMPPDAPPYVLGALPTFFSLCQHKPRLRSSGYLGEVYTYELLSNPNVQKNIWLLINKKINVEKSAQLLSFALCSPMHFRQFLALDILPSVIKAWHTPATQFDADDYGQLFDFLSQCSCSRKEKVEIFTLFGSLKLLNTGLDNVILSKCFRLVYKFYGLNIFHRLLHQLFEQVPRPYGGMEPRFDCLTERRHDEAIYAQYIREKFTPECAQLLSYFTIVDSQQMILPEALEYIERTSVLDLMQKRLLSGDSADVEDTSYIKRCLYHACYKQAREGDELWLRALFQNAQDAKRSADHIPKVQIHIGLSESAGHCIFQMRDDGIGMSLDDVLDIFCIPEISKKHHTAKDGKNFIGGRGIGVFTLYPGCEYVLLITGQGNGSVVYAKLTPEYEKDKIKDIHITYQQKPGDYQGTSVTRVSRLHQDPQFEISHLMYHAQAHADVIPGQSAEISINAQSANRLLGKICRFTVAGFGDITAYLTTRDMPVFIFSVGGLYVQTVPANRFKLTTFIRDSLFRDGRAIIVDLPEHVELTRSFQSFQNEPQFMQFLQPIMTKLAMLSLIQAFLKGEMFISGLPDDYFHRFLFVIAGLPKCKVDSTYRCDAEKLMAAKDIDDTDMYEKSEHFFGLFSHLKIFKTEQGNLFSLMELAHTFLVSQQVPKLAETPPQLQRVIKYAESYIKTRKAQGKAISAIEKSAGEHIAKHKWIPTDLAAHPNIKLIFDLLGNILKDLTEEPVTLGMTTIPGGEDMHVAQGLKPVTIYVNIFGCKAVFEKVLKGISEDDFHLFSKTYATLSLMLSHELVHSLKEHLGDYTHNEIFYLRQIHLLCEKLHALNPMCAWERYRTYKVRETKLGEAAFLKAQGIMSMAPSSQSFLDVVKLRRTLQGRFYVFYPLPDMPKQRGNTCKLTALHALMSYAARDDKKKLSSIPPVRKSGQLGVLSLRRLAKNIFGADHIVGQTNNYAVILTVGQKCGFAMEGLKTDSTALYIQCAQEKLDAGIPLNCYFDVNTLTGQPISGFSLFEHSAVMCGYIANSLAGGARKLTHFILYQWGKYFICDADELAQSTFKLPEQREALLFAKSRKGGTYTQVLEKPTSCQKCIRIAPRKEYGFAGLLLNIKQEEKRTAAETTPTDTAKSAA